MKTIDKLLLALAAWAVFALAAVYGIPAYAAEGFTDSPTCYSWEGGHKSAGSFTKCNPELQAHVAPRPAPAPAPTAVVVPPPAPVVMQSCPPPVEPKPYLAPKKAKPKPKYKC